MQRPDVTAERWLLRWLKACGFAAAGNETFDAAVRAGGAPDRLAAAEALAALLRMGFAVQASGILFLSAEGHRAAAAARRFAARLGEPPVPVPDSRLPSVTWSDADFEADGDAPNREPARRKT